MVSYLLFLIITSGGLPVVPGWLSVALLTVSDAIQAAVILIGGLLPHPVMVGHGGQEDVHHHLLLGRLLSPDPHHVGNVRSSELHISNYLTLP